jgi:hypothetical protein
LSTVKRKKKQQKALPPPVSIKWTSADEAKLPNLSEWERIVMLDWATRREQDSIQTARDVAKRFRAAAIAARDLSWQIEARTKVHASEFAPFNEAIGAIIHSNGRFRRTGDTVVDSILLLPSTRAALAKLEWATQDRAADIRNFGLVLDQIGGVLEDHARNIEEIARSQRRGTRGVFPNVASRWLLSIAATRRMGITDLVSELVGAEFALSLRFGSPLSSEVIEERCAKWKALLDSEKERL